MKIYVILAIISAILLLVIPAIAMSNTIDFKNSTISSSTIVQDTDNPENEKTISVFLTETQSTTKVVYSEYLTGVIAAELPVNYEEEAIRAQAIASHTYALYCRNNIYNNRDGDISDSPNMHQGYLTKAQRQDLWGNKFQEYENKIKTALQPVQNKILTYEGQPICAMFFALSSGQTVSAETAFGNPIPYLQSTDSHWDKDAESYKFTKKFTSKEICNIFGMQSNIKFSSPITTESGFVKTIDVCDKTVSGNTVRELLNLRSPCFEIRQENDNYIVTTCGHGHMVGMSQFGANEMAKEGKSYEEILMHYYTDVKISDE